MFDGMSSQDKDPRRSLHVDEVPLPELAPDEVFVAVMASSINFNTVWTSIFEPLPTFAFLDRLAKESIWGRRHALDYHVIGSDASARTWSPSTIATEHAARQVSRARTITILPPLLGRDRTRSVQSGVSQPRTRGVCLPPPC